MERQSGNIRIWNKYWAFGGGQPTEDEMTYVFLIHIKMTNIVHLTSNSIWLKQASINQYLQCKWTKGWNFIR